MTRTQRFKLWLAWKFRSWAERLDPTPPVPVVAVVPDPPYMSTPQWKVAWDLCYKWKEDKTVSGQYKRHQVYAVLIDQYPHEPKANLGLLIERVVQALP